MDGLTFLNQDFLPRLQSHLLSRILDQQYTNNAEDFTDEQLQQVCFRNNVIYRHKTVRINYTTYDVRRSSDTLNPRTHADFMCFSHEDDSFPYLFGRIVGVYHAEVSSIRHLPPLRNIAVWTSC